MKEHRLPEIENRKARHLYFVEETIEAGIALCGTEVKSIRAARVQMSDSHVDFHAGEAWLQGCHIDEFLLGNRWNHDIHRRRRLLLHKREIARWANAVDRKGYTAIPLKMYFKDGRVKVLVGMCRGKAEHDKRQTKLENEHKREIDRAMKSALRR
jgi:SsrA-binding protein